MPKCLALIFYLFVALNKEKKNWALAVYLDFAIMKSAILGIFY